MEESEAIAQLNRKMDRIENMLRENSANWEKMSRHIDFVDRITNRFYSIRFNAWKKAKKTS